MLTVCWFKSITDGADYLFMRFLKCLFELPSAASAVVLAISAKSFSVCGFVPHVVQYVHIHIWQKWEKIAQHFLWQPDSDRTMTECHYSIFPSYHQFCMTPQHISSMRYGNTASALVWPRWRHTRLQQALERLLITEQRNVFSFCLYLGMKKMMKFDLIWCLPLAVVSLFSGGCKSTLLGLDKDLISS